MRVSVVLPVYNHSQFLEEAIKSVISQDDLYELIIVNDGSTDPEVAQIISRYSEKEKVKSINKSNGGISDALNTGFRLATGLFYTWISADNRFRDGALRKMADYLTANRQTSLVYANVALIDHKGDRYLNKTYRPENDKDGYGELKLPRNSTTLDQFADNFINACFLYRRSDANFVGEYNQNYRGYEDYDYWLRLSFTGKVSHIGIDQPLYDYRIHESTLTSMLSWEDLKLRSEELIWEIRNRKNCLARPLNATVSNSSYYSAGSNEICQLLENSRIKCLHESQDSPLLTLSDDNGALGETSFSCEIINKSNFSSQSLSDFFLQDKYHLLSFRNGSKDERNFSIIPIKKYPLTLLRARDDNFNSITRCEGSNRTVLIFAPDYKEQPKSLFSFSKNNFKEKLKSIVDTISAYPNFTFALYCKTREQRISADQINLSLETNHNLRIIDVSDHEYDRLTPSLMYAFSSSDTVLFRLEDSASSLLELRLVTILAALAGVPVIVTNNSHFTQSKVSHLTDELLFAPNLFLYEESHSSLGELILRAPRSIRIDSLDQWLANNSYNSLGERLLSFMIAP